jgi:uncharacterized protein
MSDSERPFVIRDSPIHGKGAFAIRYIPPGVRLIEYAGARLTPAEAEARYPEQEGAHYTLLFAIDDDLVIDANVGGNDAKWVNHSCAPNCDVVVEDERLWIESIDHIVAGEELTYDYAFELKERHTAERKARYPCVCGAATCRGTMLISRRG